MLLEVPLSLDFDVDDTFDMLRAVWTLVGAYGDDAVFVRRSSSGRGWHVRVPDGVMTDVDALEMRERLNDCRGRCEADRARLSAGMKTSRLFDSKSITVIRGGKVISQKVLHVGEWMTARRWLLLYGNREPWSR